MDKQKILIVDDSEAIRHAVSDTLGAAGYEVIEAEDGLEGEQKVGAHPDLVLVICDMNMPRMGGLEMLSRIKGGGKRPDLLVLMMTTEGRPELVQEAKRLGARGWLVKPVRNDTLLSAVRKCIAAATKPPAT